VRTQRVIGKVAPNAALYAVEAEEAIAAAESAKTIAQLAPQSQTGFELSA